MKKTFLLLVMTCSMVLMSSANPVSPEEAMQIARGFIAKKQSMRIKGNRGLELAYTMMPSQKSDGKPSPLLYAFNVSGDGGFIIASGDDATPAILGYGSKGHFDIDSIPCGMRFWLDMCAEQIPLASKRAKNSPANVAEASTTSRVSISPLIDVEWGQDSPYNDQCIFDGVRCYTGCVATAMAQIAYYWGKGKEGRHFQHGCDALDSYLNWSDNVTIPALEAVPSFNWNAMTMTDGQPDTEESKAAVAQLMRYCGQAVEMDYHQYGSGAFDDMIPNAFKVHFGYSGEFEVLQASYLKNRIHYLIYRELLKGYPVYLGGIRGENLDDDENMVIWDGHAFICDGYDASDDSYHINWGWDGDFNGYFWLDYLDPYLEGISREDIIKGLENNTGGENDDPIGEFPDSSPHPYCHLNAIAGMSPWLAYKQQVGDQLTYFYDGNISSREGVVYKMDKEPTKKEIKKIIFDESFFDYNCRSEFSPNSHSLSDIYFNGFYNVNEYEGLENLNTKSMTNMAWMFEKNIHLKQLNLSSFNTSNVRVMKDMFSYCRELESVDVHTFNTSKVTDMSYMFYECKSLGSLDLSNFQIGEEAKTDLMLAGMSNLSSLKISRSMSRLANNACNATGTRLSPCVIQAPQGFDYGTETDGPYFVWKSGYFRLADSYAWGDVNHDGEVDIKDVAMTVNELLGIESKEFYIRNADFEEDNVISVADVMNIVNIILCPSPVVPVMFTCPDDHHPHMIDLGLPSGTKWACCNVGTTTPEGYGGYYAWGETKEKESYDWSNYAHCDGYGNACHDIGDDIAGTQYDVAHVKWGGNWRMPSRQQMDELAKNCTYTWTTKNNISGAQFTGPNGGTIFLPASNFYTDEAPSNFENGYYWTSTLDKSYITDVYSMYFYYLEANSFNFSLRCSGLPVRPVWIGE